MSFRIPIGLPMPEDQASWDALRADPEVIESGLAEALPEAFDFISQEAVLRYFDQHHIDYDPSWRLDAGSSGLVSQPTANRWINQLRQTAAVPSRTEADSQDYSTDEDYSEDDGAGQATEPVIPWYEESAVDSCEAPEFLNTPHANPTEAFIALRDFEVGFYDKAIEHYTDLLAPKEGGVSDLNYRLFTAYYRGLTKSDTQAFNNVYETLKFHGIDTIGIAANTGMSTVATLCNYYKQVITKQCQNMLQCGGYLVSESNVEKMLRTGFKEKLADTGIESGYTNYHLLPEDAAAEDFFHMWVKTDATAMSFLRRIEASDDFDKVRTKFEDVRDNIADCREDTAELTDPKYLFDLIDRFPTAKAKELVYRDQLGIDEKLVDIARAGEPRPADVTDASWALAQRIVSSESSHTWRERGKMAVRFGLVLGAAVVAAYTAGTSAAFAAAVVGGVVGTAVDYWDMDQQYDVARANLAADLTIEGYGGSRAYVQALDNNRTYALLAGAAGTSVAVAGAPIVFTGSAAKVLGLEFLRNSIEGLAIGRSDGRIMDRKNNQVLMAEQGLEGQYSPVQGLVMSGLFGGVMGVAGAGAGRLLNAAIGSAGRIMVEQVGNKMRVFLLIAQLSGQPQKKVPIDVESVNGRDVVGVADDGTRFRFTVDDADPAVVVAEREGGEDVENNAGRKPLRPHNAEQREDSQRVYANHDDNSGVPPVVTEGAARLKAANRSVNGTEVIYLLRDRSTGSMSTLSTGSATDGTTTGLSLETIQPAATHVLIDRDTGQIADILPKAPEGMKPVNPDPNRYILEPVDEVAIGNEISDRRFSTALPEGQEIVGFYYPGRRQPGKWEWYNMFDQAEKQGSSRRIVVFETGDGSQRIVVIDVSFHEQTDQISANDFVITYSGDDPGPTYRASLLQATERYTKRRVYEATYGASRKYDSEMVADKTSTEQANLDIDNTGAQQTYQKKLAWLESFENVVFKSRNELGTVTQGLYDRLLNAILWPPIDSGVASGPFARSILICQDADRALTQMLTPAAIDGILTNVRHAKDPNGARFAIMTSLTSLFKKSGIASQFPGKEFVVRFRDAQTLEIRLVSSDVANMRYQSRFLAQSSDEVLADFEEGAYTEAKRIRQRALHHDDVGGDIQYSENVPTGFVEDNFEGLWRVNPGNGTIERNWTRFQLDLAAVLQRHGVPAQMAFARGSRVDGIPRANSDFDLAILITQEDYLKMARQRIAEIRNPDKKREAMLRLNLVQDPDTNELQLKTGVEAFTMFDSDVPEAPGLTERFVNEIRELGKQYNLPKVSLLLVPENSSRFSGTICPLSLTDEAMTASAQAVAQ